MDRVSLIHNWIFSRVSGPRKHATKGANQSTQLRKPTTSRNVSTTSSTFATFRKQSPKFQGTRFRSCRVGNEPSFHPEQLFQPHIYPDLSCQVEKAELIKVIQRQTDQLKTLSTGSNRGERKALILTGHLRGIRTKLNGYVRQIILLEKLLHERRPFLAMATDKLKLCNRKVVRNAIHSGSKSTKRISLDPLVEESIQPKVWFRLQYSCLDPTSDSDTVFWPHLFI